MDGYAPRNGARDAPVNRPGSTGSTLGEDFPMVCETCLGPNPYVRMTKLPYGHKLCKISNLPYQAFRWKAGPQGRQKETIISIAVAKERNICQTCLNDMKFGLPVGVRDSILKQDEESTQLTLPRSNVGQQYFYEQQAQLTAGTGSESTNMALEVANIAPTRQLDTFSRMMQASEGKSKVAFRNLPKLCSFWLNGTCTRVLRKTCPFRPCCGTYLFPEIAGSAATKKLSDQLIEALNKDGPAAVQKSIDAETKSAIQQALKGNRDDAIRKRVSGEDDLSKKYLGRMKAMHLELDPPEDQSIVTLWLGNIDEDISDSDIREVIYPFGYIVNLVLVRSGRCAFVEYADRATAEHAAKQMYNSLTIKGYPISVNWAKPRAIALGGEYDLTVPESSSLQLPPGMNRPPQPDSLPPQLMAFIPQVRSFYKT